MTDARGRPLRVLHVGKFYPPSVGGIETHVQALCVALRPAAEVQVLVASGDRSASAGVEDGVPVTRAGTTLHLASAPLCPGMVRVLRDTAADIVHLHLPNPGAVLAWLAVRPPARLVVTYHSDVVRQRWLGAVFEPLVDRLLRRSAAIVATSSAYAESSPALRRHRSRVRVIPYGIAVERFARAQPEPVAEIRRRWGPRLVLSVGRLTYYKGFEYLLRAMRRVHGRLLLIGDGPMRTRLGAEARALGVEERVAFLGEMANHDLPPYYQAADVFALPSVARSEAFGIVQIEAMASGTPVVNTQLESGVPFVSLHGTTGLTVPPHDHDGLANALNLILEDPQRRARYGEAARRRANDEFGLALMVERTLGLYRDVMAPS